MAKSTTNDADIAIEAAQQAVKAITASYTAAPLGDGEPTRTLPIGATSLDALHRAADQAGASLEKLSPRVKTSDAVLLLTAENVPLVYARPGSASYRNYLHRGVEAGYMMDMVDAGVTGYDVDHVASRSSSKRLGLNYVLLAAVDSLSNQSYASIEHALCDAPRGGIVRPNLLQIMKINNIPLMRTNSDPIAGLGIMIGEAAHQKIISKKLMMKYYGIGLRTGQRVGGRVG